MAKKYGFCNKPATKVDKSSKLTFGQTLQQLTRYNMHKFYKIIPAHDHMRMDKIRVFSWCLTAAKTGKVRAENDSNVTKIRPVFTKSESSLGKGKTIRHYDSDDKIRKNPRKTKIVSKRKTR